MAGEGVWGDLVAENPGAFTPAAATPAEPVEEPTQESVVVPVPAEGEPTVEAVPPMEEDPHSIEPFIDAEGKVDWKGLEAKPWYKELTPEAVASLKGTISQYRTTIATKSSVKINEAVTEARTLKATTEALQQQVQTLTEALQTAISNMGKSQNQPPAAPPRPPALQQLVDSGYLTEEQLDAITGTAEQAALEKLSKKFGPTLEAAERNNLALASKAFFDDARANWPKDEAHPVPIDEVIPNGRIPADVMKANPWIDKAGAAMAEAGASAMELLEFAYTATLRARPDLLRAAVKPVAQPAAPPPPKPAPGKTGASPVVGAAPVMTTPKANPEEVADAWVKQVKKVR